MITLDELLDPMDSATTNHAAAYKCLLLLKASCNPQISGTFWNQIFPGCLQVEIGFWMNMGAPHSHVDSVLMSPALPYSTHPWGATETSMKCLIILKELRSSILGWVGDPELVIWTSSCGLQVNRGEMFVFWSCWS